MKDARGNTVYGTPEDQRGALIDTTSPECGKWYFDTIKKNYGDLGYKYYWTDEDEPDISPHESFCMQEPERAFIISTLLPILNVSMKATEQHFPIAA